MTWNPRGPQQGCEGAVQFVAESAAAKGDYLPHDCVFVDDDFAAERDVEILEWNCQQVGIVEGPKIFARRLRRAGVGDAGQIGRYIEHNDSAQAQHWFVESFPLSTVRPQRLKPLAACNGDTARLKACPDTNRLVR